MRLRSIASVLSPVILIIGCDLIPQAYDSGYGCGYQYELLGVSSRVELATKVREVTEKCVLPS